MTQKEKFFMELEEARDEAKKILFNALEEAETEAEKIVHSETLNAAQMDYIKRYVYDMTDYFTYILENNID